MSNLSKLGVFQLGQVQLGASVGQIQVSDSFGVADDISIEFEAFVSDSFAMVEVLTILNEFSESESFSIDADILTYAGYGAASVRTRIVLPLDVTSEDFCKAVEETGQGFELNDVPQRAFIQVQHSERGFANNIRVKAGDAIMYSCPERFLVAVGDIVFFNDIHYGVATWKDQFIGGNLILQEVALKRIDINSIPVVTGLTASPNLEGKTTLTWNAVDKSVSLHFDYYEIHRSLNDVDYELIGTTKSTKYSDKNLTPNTIYYYRVFIVDIYKYVYGPSNTAETPTDTTPPDQVTGVR